MGRAGKALKQVLEAHNISQNQLAVTMGIGRSSINRWVNESRDPAAEAILEIVEALDKLHEAAAKEFLALILGRFAQNQD
jgi:transcriptional regulator with XRE-family HTH domain